MEPLLTSAAALFHENGPAVLWSLALGGGVGYSVRSARNSGLDPRVAYWASVTAILTGLLGSRLLGMIVYPMGPNPGWREIILGGHSYYGGLLGGAFGAIAYFRLHQAPLLRHADAMTPAVALAYATGRVGCFFNGDDYGVLSNGAFAVRYPNDTEAFVSQVQRGLIDSSQALSLPVLPVQLFHAAFGLLLFGLLVRPEAVPGRRLGRFALCYGIGRFALEFARGEFTAAVGPLSLHQAISLGLVAAGAALLLRTRPRLAAAVS